MKNNFIISILILALGLSSCRDDDDNGFDGTIPEFNFPRTTSFADSLSAYGIFDGNPADLIASSDFELIELNSVLFTDYAHKQRLVKVPTGAKIKNLGNGRLDFPNGSILTKTFYYWHDERDTSLGRNIVETRLLIKEGDRWNAATYVWNKEQDEAILKNDGLDRNLSWIGAEGQTKSTFYHIPSENECKACHQYNNAMTWIGPSVANLNRDVVRQGQSQNLLSYLQAQGKLEVFDPNTERAMADYKNTSTSLSERGRAYLAINCAHCHSPQAWEEPANRDFDFRYRQTYANTGIAAGKDKIERNMVEGEMPFIGTSLKHDEGIALLIEYLNNL